MTTINISISIIRLGCSSVHVHLFAVRIMWWNSFSY